MPAIKGISTNSIGNVTITPSTGLAVTKLRTTLIKSVESIDTGLADKTKTAYDVYTHCYEDLTMKNPKRTATLVCNKGIVPPKNWWINKDIKFTQILSTDLWKITYGKAVKEVIK